MTTQEYITKPHLKNRGWTDAMVKKFLGAPDMTKPNPHYKKAAPMGLWDAKRVSKAERSQEWQTEKEKSIGRKASAQKAVKTKTDKAKEFARTVDIHVPVMDYNEVVKKACWSYNDFHEYLFMERGHDYTPADMDSNPDFLCRITMNYLRHECTSYEKQLYKLFGKTGVHEAHDILQQRINAEIMRVYPQLNNE